MARYLTGGMLVICDRHPASESALRTALEYAPKTVALADPQVGAIPGVERTVHPGRAGLSIDEAFRCAAADRIPWVAMRRDFVEPEQALGQMLLSAGRRATQDLPGVAVLLAGARPRPIRRMLAVVDRADGDPSGLMTLVAVAAAQATGAELEVLVLGAPGETLTTPERASDILRVERDKDLFDQARRRADQGGRATWIVVDEPTDRTSLVLDQVAYGDYDLIVEDLGALRLGGRLGRDRRISRALAPGGRGAITRALLERTDVPLAIVLDGVRLGVVSPAAVKGGAGALLAVGLLAGAAPIASASTGDEAHVQTTVSQTVDTHDPLDQTAETPDAEGESTAQADASSAEAAAAEETADAAAAEETAESTGEDQSTEATGQAAASEAAEKTAAASEATGPSDTADEDAQAATYTTSEDSSQPAPSELAPEEVTPQEAPEVSPESIEVAEDVDSGDVAEAQESADQTRAELDEAQAEFDSMQDEAVDVTADAEQAADDAAAAQDQLVATEQAYQQTYTETEAVIDDATGLTGALPGGATDTDLAAAEQARADASAEVAAAEQAAVDASEAAQAATVEATEVNAELEAAAADVTTADAAHQEASAAAEATESAYEEAMADARISPVPGYEIGTEYGVPGANWSSGYHTGVDYAAESGTPVVAAASGTVVYAQNDGGAYGNRVVIEHAGGYYTTYSHLSQIDVEVGQEVTAGDTLGEVGSTGNSTGPHLHFEVTQGGDGWSSGSFVDPAAWLSGEA